MQKKTWNSSVTTFYRILLASESFLIGWQRFAKETIVSIFMPRASNLRLLWSNDACRTHLMQLSSFCLALQWDPRSSNRLKGVFPDILHLDPKLVRGRKKQTHVHRMRFDEAEKPTVNCQRVWTLCCATVVPAQSWSLSLNKMLTLSPRWLQLNYTNWSIALTAALLSK